MRSLATALLFTSSLLAAPVGAEAPLTEARIMTMFQQIEAAVRNGIDATGPHPADTVFTAALNGRYDLVVAMYHDQGLIPVKMLARDRSVNVTLGLPTVRTSPDHGTAFDIAGTGMAEEGSMKNSIDLALSMIRCAPFRKPRISPMHG